MKLKDIVTSAVANKSTAIMPRQINSKVDPARQEQRAPLKADAAGLVVSCPTLAADELEFLKYVLERLRADARYVPSPIVMQLIVDANTRIWTASGTAGH